MFFTLSTICKLLYKAINRDKGGAIVSAATEEDEAAARTKTETAGKAAAEADAGG